MFNRKVAEHSIYEKVIFSHLLKLKMTRQIAFYSIKERKISIPHPCPIDWMKRGGIRYGVTLLAIKFFG